MFGDEGTLDKYEEDKNNGDCDTGSVSAELHEGFRLRFVSDSRCRICTGEIRSLEGLPTESVVISNESLEVVNKFCYFGDII